MNASEYLGIGELGRLDLFCTFKFTGCLGELAGEVVAVLEVESFVHGS